MSGTSTSNPVRIPILLYHRIAADSEDPFAVSPALFAQHIAVIAASGCSPLTIGQLADGVRGAVPLPPRPLAITFDDGFQNTPDAVGALIANGLSATVYVTAGTLDQPGALRTSQLLALGRQVELGAHSITHPHLDALSAPKLRDEVAGSKRLLEELLERRIDTFAYPHGAYDPQVRAAVLDAGFFSAAAVKNAISHEFDDPWALARYTVTDADSPERLEQLLNGHGAPLAWRGQRLRTRAARAMRRARCRVRETRSATVKSDRDD